MRSWHFWILVTVTLFAAFGPPERTTPERWALVVGISDYIHFGDEIGGDLPGAANDARAMADVLVNRYGFAPENVKVVVDRAATRGRLESELTGWLPSVARDGDHIFFFFAGHGSQAWDMDGDEPDGLDETFCPADVMRGSTDADITDDRMNGWLRGLPTDNVVVVWDKCHAKSSTRAVTPFARPRSLDRDVRRDVPRPDAAPDVADAVTEDAAGDWAGLEIAAAQADEVAIDAVFGAEDEGGVTYGGAFTTFFVRNLWNAPAGASYDDVFQRTKRDLARERFAQQPDIDQKSIRNAPVFAAADGAGAIDRTGASVPVVESGGGTAVLAGGAAADMTRGSVYRAGGALLRIERVESERAHATVIEGEAPAAGASAELVAYRHPDPRLRVSVGDLPASLREDLAARLAQRNGLELLADPAAFAHLIVRPRSEHYVILGLDGFPRDSARAGDAAVERLAALLVREHRALQLAELENPAQPFRVDFEFGNDRNDFRLGEEVTFRLRSERTGYLTIVDVDPAGAVTVLFPNGFDSDNRVEAGERMAFPTETMLEQARFEAIEPTGRGLVRVFVTEHPMRIPDTDAPIAVRVWGALRDAAGTASSAADAVPVESWATAAIAYEIRR